MSTKLERLFFTIEMMDKTSAGVNGIMGKFDQLQQRAQKGMASIATGAGGLLGTGYAIKSMMAPSIQMNEKLGEVRSLDVNEKALAVLSRKALMHSMKYGTSAANFVGASYDIQSAISGLSGMELASFTGASAVLAKATKSDVATATNYTGTMYGIFQKQAERMGKTNWIEQLVGQTALAVQMFKTTGSEMSGAFSSIGADATAGGVAMNEQMAILGTLQATMSGSEAGTKYKAFLAGVGKAQSSLGLTFTDSAGQMLPMVNILETLKGRFGETFDVAESDALKTAFGSKEAVSLIKLLMQDTSGLATNITKLGKLEGMNNAEKMAKANTNIWDKLGKTVEAVTISFGMVLQPVLDPLLDSLAAGGATIVRWTQLFPNLTKYMGIATLAVFTLVAGVSALALIGGIGTMAMTGLTLLMPLWTAGMWLANAALSALKIVLFFSQIAMYGFGIAVNLATWPVLLIIAAVAALAVGAYFLYKKWDDLTKSFMESEGLKTAIGWINALIEKINLMPGIDIGLVNLPGNDLPVLGDDKNTLPSSFKANDAIVPFNLPSNDLPALSDDKGTFSSSFKANHAIVPTIDARSSDPYGAGSGGLMQQISNSMSNNQKSFNVEKIEMNGTDKNGFDLWDELQMAGS